MANVKVLIVDDCNELRYLLSSILNKENGITIVGEASNGVEAMNYIANNEVDIVLLDIIMPKMDGFALMSEMVRSSIDPIPKVIIISGLAREDFKQRAFDLGATSYLVKPFDVCTLLKRIWQAA